MQTFSFIPLGALATVLLDLFALVRRRLSGTPLPNYGLVGRWLLHMPRGRFRHAPIAASAPMRGERIVGWIAHYLVGIGFAALLLSLTGIDWLRQPTLLPALLVGLGTVLAPFLLMQPGMGAGIAARLAPNPGAARRQSLLTHALFGLSLYLAGLAISRLHFA